MSFALKKKISCFVTNPIEKKIIKKKKKNFDGHTHYIANMVSTKNPVMMLSSPKINVVPITQHMSLKKALKKITKKRIVETIIITNQYLKKYFGIKKPKIAVAGLNPHAGENGAFGNEEKGIEGNAFQTLEPIKSTQYELGLKQQFQNMLFFPKIKFFLLIFSEV